MNLEWYYYRLVNNINKAEDLYNIMFNVENLLWIFEVEKYQKRRLKRD